MIFDKEQLEIIREAHPDWFLDINRWYTNDFGLMVYAEKQEVGRQFLGYGTLGGGEPWQQRSSFVLNSDGVRLANKEEVLGAKKKKPLIGILLVTPLFTGGSMKTPLSPMNAQ